MRVALRSLGFASLLTLAGLTSGWSTEAVVEARAEEPAEPTLDAALRQEAGKILAKVRSQGYRNIGVLKFMVRGEGGELRDNVGSLNYSLPDRLEVALVLALDPKVKDSEQMGIITRTNHVIEKSGNKKVNHLTPDGREAFYRSPSFKKMSPFKKAWGNEEIPVNDDLAFLTGEVTLSRDLKTMHVRVFFFGPRDPKPYEPIPIDDFTAGVDLRTLGDVGVTYTTRGVDVKGFKAGDKQEVTGFASKQAVQPGETEDSWRQKGESALKVLDESPLKLEIRYTRKNQPSEKIRPIVNPIRPPSEFDWVLLNVRTPADDEEVSFMLTNTSKTDTYGVVLRINGQNTIFPDKDVNAGDIDSYKWVLDPGKTTVVRGWQKRNMKDEWVVDPFKVLPDTAAKKDEVKYGEKTGTLSMTVFVQARTEPENQLADEEQKQPDANLSIGRGAQALSVETRPNTLAALQADLKGEARKAVDGRPTRGYIGGTGEEKPNQVKVMTLKWRPLPEEQVVIRYFAARP